MTEKKEIGRRLAGARRMRGYLSSGMAADAIGFDPKLYGAYEGSALPYARGHARILADLFGVTSNFLKHGKASTLADRRAEDEMDDPDPVQSRWSIYDRMRVADRLKSVRLARGFRTMSAAADRFGWTSSVYSEIEAGRRAFDAEQIEAYGHAFAVPADFFTDSGVPVVYDPRYHEMHVVCPLKSGPP